MKCAKCGTEEVWPDQSLCASDVHGFGFCSCAFPGVHTPELCINALTSKLANALRALEKPTGTVADYWRSRAHELEAQLAQLLTPEDYEQSRKTLLLENILDDLDEAIERAEQAESHLDAVREFDAALDAARDVLKESK